MLVVHGDLAFADGGVHAAGHLQRVGADGVEAGAVRVSLSGSGRAAAEAGEEHRVISRWAPGAVDASGVPAGAPAEPPTPVSSRFTASRRGIRFGIKSVLSFDGEGA
jgi:hypothetical protein